MVTLKSPHNLTEPSGLGTGVAGNPSRQEICPGRDGFPRKLVSELGNPSRPACSRKSVSDGTDFLGNRSRS